ncbi:transmembrane protein 150C [Chelmon rostratus]|uniref:transmembrane protein 150C n=1 Tax=Chelmon rostratus TaxID=109905 RepID=UPI001BE71C1C|nr:transmembrane protein 150C [Chelmon rostratus]XP_041816331.1 transmembrane protein 150C [Chelmon rostratus]XP_041816333.1 transmembrane protein 150C [Chelmon rostratus]
MLKCGQWALLPPIFSAFTAAGLWLVYFIAVHDEKIVPLGSKSWRTNGSFYPPYISIAGNFPPASCIFSEVMNLSAFLAFFTAVLRYLQLKPRIDKPWLNVGSLTAFSIGCFGMTLVGNFQLFSDEVIHNLGTFMTFGLGTLYCWAQSYITLRVDIKNEGRRAGIVRFLLSGSITLCMVLYFSLMGLGLHTQAAQCQWALVMFFLIFLGTFAIEFRHSRFDIVCTDDCGRPLSLSENPSEASTYQPDEP